MNVEGDLILDPKAIAKQFISEAVKSLRQAEQQAHIEFLADQAAMARLEHSAACKRGWAKRKRGLAGATAAQDAPEDDE